jgi:hypothetical protein
MKGSILMKQTLTLTLLIFILLSLSQSQAVAQNRSKSTTTSTQTVESRVPSNLVNIPKYTGTPPKILGTSSGIVYDVDALNATTSNARTPRDSGQSVYEFIGFAFSSNNTLYGVTSAFSTNPVWRSRLFTISPNNTFSTLGIGPSLNYNGNPFYCIDGDLAYDKMLPGYMYATCNDNGTWRLITIKLSNGAVTFKGQLPAASGIYGNPTYAALAFNPAGELYTLDTYNKKLYKVNKNNASVISAIALTGPLPIPSTTGSMSFSASGGLYASFGGKLVVIDIANGAVGVIGNDSFTGLIVSGGSGPFRQN